MAWATSPARTKWFTAGSVQVHGISNSVVGEKMEAAVKKGQDDPIKQLMARIDALTNLVDNLQHSMAVRERGCQGSTSQRVSCQVNRLCCCRQCTEEGRQDCAHCLICGEEGHWAAGCLRRPQWQGNKSRPLQRDNH